MLIVILLAGCTPPWTPQTAATVAPGAVTLSTTSLTFTAAGATNAQIVVASESDYTGSFTASTTTCNGIATIAATGGSSFTVTPVAAGSCTFAIAGGGTSSATLSVGVTTTTVGGN